MASRCVDCVYCVAVEYGYSNYTVEGVNAYCAKELNPEMPFDNWYGEDDRHKFAENCPSFIHGAGVLIDCEQEDKDWGTDDVEVKWAEYSTEYVTGSDIDRIVG